MMQRRNPSLYQINTRVYLTELSRLLERSATLDDIADVELDRWRDLGFDWIWLLSVWRTGPASQKVSRTNQQWRHEFQETLPDLQEADIGGSGFAITGYKAAPVVGGEAALARLRQRLRERGLKLMLDFVPNHVALDHPWVEDHPEYLVAGTEALLLQQPQNYVRVRRRSGDRVLAYGRDPYFPGWPDTLQLDYSNPATQEVMIQQLQSIASQCDGVRCDMAMLVLPEVFERTWNRKAAPFWPGAIQRVRERDRDFCFMAEVYWDLEWTLQQQGFDYTYDKRLYDRLREGQARPIREHLHAELDYQTKLARFLENHDEPRAAVAFDPLVHRAAAVLTFLLPGLRFFHQGQFEGRKKRISPHLVRAPEEAVDKEMQRFYDDVLAILRKPIVQSGDWQALPCQPAWEGNGSCDSFVAHAWSGADGQRMLVVVNYAPHPSQCYVHLPFSEMKNCAVRFEDSLCAASYDRAGDDLLERGLYVDMQPWAYHVFDMEMSKAIAVEPEKRVTR